MNMLIRRIHVEEHRFEQFRNSSALFNTKACNPMTDSDFPGLVLLAVGITCLTIKKNRLLSKKNQKTNHSSISEKHFVNQQQRTIQSII